MKTLFLSDNILFHWFRSSKIFKGVKLWNLLLDVYFNLILWTIEDRKSLHRQRVRWVCILKITAKQVSLKVFRVNLSGKRYACIAFNCKIEILQNNRVYNLLFRLNFSWISFLNDIAFADKCASWVWNWINRHTVLKLWLSDLFLNIYYKISLIGKCVKTQVIGNYIMF